MPTPSGAEQITLWLEAKPKLYAGRAEIVSKAPIFTLKMLYSDIKAEAICREINSRYHWFRVSSELSDKATTFWSYQFWLLSAKVTPEIVVEGEAQWMYLRFRVEDFPGETDFDLITRGPWDAYKYRPAGRMGRYEEETDHADT